jgi:hypothetical protein
MKIQNRIWILKISFTNQKSKTFVKGFSEGSK